MNKKWNDVWEHYKGGLYNVITIGTHTETENRMVVYEDEDGNIWIRPLEMFIGKVHVNGKTVYRFKKLGYSYE